MGDEPYKVIVGVILGIVALFLVSPFLLSSGVGSLSEEEKASAYSKTMPMVIGRLPNPELASFPPYSDQVRDRVKGELVMEGEVHSADTEFKPLTYTYRLTAGDATEDAMKATIKQNRGLDVTFSSGFSVWRISSITITGKDFTYNLPDRLVLDSTSGSVFVSN